MHITEQKQIKQKMSSRKKPNLVQPQSSSDDESDDETYKENEVNQIDVVHESGSRQNCNNSDSIIGNSS